MANRQGFLLYKRLIYSDIYKLCVTLIEYHRNGQLRFKGTYKDGKKEGHRVFYDSDGSEVVVED